MTTVKQYADVKKSPLYKTIAPSLSREDRKEFARMLEMVENGDLSRTNIDAAFFWEATPQGHGYWQELAGNLDRAGVPGGTRCGWAAWR